jgi:hypothetical protein
MIAPDINILLYALREESERHVKFRAWLKEVLSGDEPVALFEPVLAGVLRIGTHLKIYKTPTPRKVIEGFIDDILSSPLALALRAGQRHWSLFLELCRRADCKGNLIQDAYLAALALENNCKWITTDRDFARFPGLVWRHPLDDVKDTRNPA